MGTDRPCDTEKFRKLLMAKLVKPFRRDSDSRKAELIRWAKAGKPRPNSTSKDLVEKRLAGALKSYTCPSSDCYYPEFTTVIQSLAPQWFRNKAAENRKTLIEWAKAGKPRPNSRSKDQIEKRLGKVFNHYMCPSSDCYDPEFIAVIQSLEPQWLIDTAAEKKKRLLEWVKVGNPRPSIRSKDPVEKRLAWSLVSYTSPSHGCYDSEFTTLIRSLAPHTQKTKESSRPSRCS